MTDTPQANPSPQDPATNPYAQPQQQPYTPPRYQATPDPAPTAEAPAAQPYGAPQQPYGAQQQPYAQPDPYAQPATAPYSGYAQPYGYAPTLPEHPQATMILIHGILSLLVSGLTGPFAWVMGNKAKKEIAAGQYAPSSSVTIGWVLGIIGTVFLGLAVLMIILAIVMAIVAASSGY